MDFAACYGDMCLANGECADGYVLTLTCESTTSSHPAQRPRYNGVACLGCDEGLVLSDALECSMCPSFIKQLAISGVMFVAGNILVAYLVKKNSSKETILVLHFISVGFMLCNAPGGT